VGSCCHMVLLPWAAILIGCSAAIISVLGYLYITVSMIYKLFLLPLCSLVVCMCVRMHMCVCHHSHVIRVSVNKHSSNCTIGIPACRVWSPANIYTIMASSMESSPINA